METKTVKLDLGDGVTAEVEVKCFGATSDFELQELAKSRLRTVVNRKISRLSGIGASLGIIAEFQANRAGGV